MFQLKHFVSAAAGFSISVLLSGTALAQALPTTVDAGRLRSDITNEFQRDTISTPLDIRSAPDVTAPAGAEKITMILKKVIVEGASRLSKEQIATVYADKLNKKISLAEVYLIANDITDLYRKNGYILSRAIVPQQQIRDGVVRIQVIEGRISRYSVQGEGNRHGIKDQIEAYAEKLVSTGTLNTQNLERYLLLMNDLPGVQVRSVLTPSATAFGGTDLTLVVEQRKFQGSTSFDNFGNKFIGPQRFTLSGQANSLFRATDQINATALLAPLSNELQYYTATYSQVISPEGTKAGLTATYAETNPTLPDTLGGLLDPKGRSYALSANVLHPFIRSRAFNLNGGASFEVNRNETNYDDVAFTPLETEDKLRVARLSAQATYLDSYAGYNTGEFTLSKGFEMLGSSEKGDTNLSRAAGDPSFTKVSMAASRLQRIYGALSGLVAVTGQYSANSLLITEQFGYGGSQFGRGYDFSELTGDHGLAAKVELGYTLQTGQQFFSSYQPYVFYDIGKVWNRAAAAGVSSNDSAASAGIGTRFTVTPVVLGDVFIAKPLTQDVTSRGTNGDDLRIKFALSASF